ncbi:hypothetical protein Nepgr_011168 [Nepenthes gracilis]|uniref:Calcineurin B-like protein n=1 Tax=Nepenthes gracilis TaxID=150966 RepID=A0AAD3XLQ7_NEPGR|nr:hypothetical protein Nepgr_011168 [Nepenthes gracilis]
MGCKFSKKTRKNSGINESAVILASQTSFTVNEVEALHILYKKLSSSILDDGLIHKEEFQLALLGSSSRKHNLFVDRVFQLFDLKQDGVIEFEEFVRSLSIFHPRTPQVHKIAFAFHLYDLQQTGYIEREELKQMVLATLEESNLMISDDHIEAILDKTFMEADSKGDGRIDLEEWTEFVAKNPALMKNMTLSYLADVSTTFPSFLIYSEVQDSDLTVGKDHMASSSWMDPK